MRPDSCAYSISTSIRTIIQTIPRGGSSPLSLCVRREWSGLCCSVGVGYAGVLLCGRVVDCVRLWALAYGADSVLGSRHI